MEDCSINDLKEMIYMGSELTDDQQQAIKNYELHRINALNELNRGGDDKEFHDQFKQLQVEANLWPWRDFLKEEYQTTTS